MPFYPAVITHPVSGSKVLGIVEQFLDRVITPQQAGLSNDEAIELLQRRGGTHPQAGVPLFPSVA